MQVIAKAGSHPRSRRLPCRGLLLALFVALLAVPALPAAGATAERMLTAIEQRYRDGAPLAPAVPHLKRLLGHSDPAISVGAALHLGYALLEADRVDDAFALWTREAVTAAAPATRWWVPLRLAVARARHRRGEGQQAVAVIDALISNHATRVDADLVRAADLAGRIHQAAGHPDRARRAWRWALAYAERHFSDPAAEGLDLAALRRSLRDLDHSDQPPTADELFAQAERLRRGERWAQARARYTRLYRDFPDSRHRPAAAWAIGACWLGARAIDRAAAHWRAFIDADPSGPWRAQAAISLGDMLWEHRFDLAGGKAVFDAAYRLYEDGPPTAAGWSEAAYDLHQRQGIIAYLRRDHDGALALFEEAARNHPPRIFVESYGGARVGIERLIDRLRRGQEVTPPEVLAGPGPGRLASVLGDIHYVCDDFDRAGRIHRRLAAGDESIAANATQRSWARFQLGRIANLSFEFEPAVRHYLAVADGDAGQPWQAEALLLASVVYYSNMLQKEQSLTCLRRIIREHPRSEYVDRAAYYIGVLHEWTGEHDRAARVYRQFLARYPKSKYAPVIREEHLPAVTGGTGP